MLIDGAFISNRNHNKEKRVILLVDGKLKVQHSIKPIHVDNMLSVRNFNIDSDGSQLVIFVLIEKNDNKKIINTKLLIVQEDIKGKLKILNTNIDTDFNFVPGENEGLDYSLKNNLEKSDCSLKSNLEKSDCSLKSNLEKSDCSLKSNLGKLQLNDILYFPNYTNPDIYYIKHPILRKLRPLNEQNYKLINDLSTDYNNEIKLSNGFIASLIGDIDWKPIFGNKDAEYQLLLRYDNVNELRILARNNERAKKICNTFHFAIEYLKTNALFNEYYLDEFRKLKEQYPIFDIKCEDIITNTVPDYSNADPKIPIPVINYMDILVQIMGIASPYMNIESSMLYLTEIFKSLNTNSDSILQRFQPLLLMYVIDYRNLLKEKLVDKEHSNIVSFLIHYGSIDLFKYLFEEEYIEMTEQFGDLLAWCCIVFNRLDLLLLFKNYDFDYDENLSSNLNIIFEHDRVNILETINVDLIQNSDNIINIAMYNRHNSVNCIKYILKFNYLSDRIKEILSNPNFFKSILSHLNLSVIEYFEEKFRISFNIDIQFIYSLAIENNVNHFKKFILSTNIIHREVKTKSYLEVIFEDSNKETHILEVNIVKFLKKIWNNTRDIEVELLQYLVEYLQLGPYINYTMINRLFLINPNLIPYILTNSELKSTLSKAVDGGILYLDCNTYASWYNDFLPEEINLIVNMLCDQCHLELY